MTAEAGAEAAARAGSSAIAAGMRRVKSMVTGY
jgi:hypothetical protein